MGALEFGEVIALVNSARIAQIDPTPKASTPGQWELFGGEYRAHVATVPFEVLYLHAGVTTDSAKQAHRDVFRAGQTQVVYAPSLDGRLRIHEELFQRSAKGYWNTRAYLASFIQSELDAYR